MSDVEMPWYTRYFYGLRVPLEDHLKRDLFASPGHTVVLWYPTAPLARLLRDIDILAQGLQEDAVMRVYSDSPEALTAVPDLCAAHGYTLLPYQPHDPREGDYRPFGQYHFDITRTLRG